jgi:Zn-dependent peptidase ImmA (M78 family)
MLPPMVEALVNPRLLTWARERERLDEGAIAAALKVKPEKVAAWESGELRPTFAQAERWAEVTHTPFGWLFAPQPPEELPLPPDFRTLDGRPHQPSPGFRDLYADVLFKQDWFRTYRESQGFPPAAFVGSVKPSVTPVELARIIRTTVDLDRNVAGSVDDAYRRLITAAEAAGIWVLRSGTVGGNTHRAVPVEEFRGFAIADRMVPLVFINARDAITAQLFTLVHELAHLWVGATGVSDPFSKVTNPIERLCNAAAAEFLVPGQELVARWRKRAPMEEQCIALAREFKVSPAVVALRARALNLATQGDVDAFLEKQRATWRRQKQSRGGNFYVTALTRNGRFFARAVLAAAASQELLLRDAGQLLNMSPAKVMVAARREGVTR